MFAGDSTLELTLESPGMPRGMSMEESSSESE